MCANLRSAVKKESEIKQNKINLIKKEIKICSHKNIQFA